MTSLLVERVWGVAIARPIQAYTSRPVEAGHRQCPRWPRQCRAEYSLRVERPVGTSRNHSYLGILPKYFANFVSGSEAIPYRLRNSLSARKRYIRAGRGISERKNAA